MRVNILHDKRGKIIATLTTSDLEKAGCKKIAMVPRRGEEVLEIELSGELEHTPKDELHRDYRIDLKTSQIVKKEKVLKKGKAKVVRKKKS